MVTRHERNRGEGVGVGEGGSGSTGERQREAQVCRWWREQPVGSQRGGTWRHVIGMDQRDGAQNIWDGRRIETTGDKIGSLPLTMMGARQRAHGREAAAADWHLGAD